MSNINKELQKELIKNKADEYVIMKELRDAKLKMINELNVEIEKDLKNGIKDINKPIKIKRPFTYKIKQFFNRISKVLGN